MPSYHDLHVTTPDIPRASVFNLPYGLQVMCTRVSGWELWRTAAHPADWVLLAGEYAAPEKWLVLDVDGHVIVDSRKRPPDQDLTGLSSKKSCITLSYVGASCEAAVPCERGPDDPARRPGEPPYWVQGSPGLLLSGGGLVEQTDAAQAMKILYEEYALIPPLAKLAAGRRLVPGHGLFDAPLMVVGEAPGAQEEIKGRPFVGPAGTKLQKLFGDAKIPWEYCYVTNVVPWRPPANRTPYPHEVQASWQRLAAEVTMVDPIVIVAAGDVAWRGLTRSTMGRFADARFGWHDLMGRRLLAIPHPSYLLHLKDPAERARWEKATVEALAQALPQAVT